MSSSTVASSPAPSSSPAAPHTSQEGQLASLKRRLNSAQTQLATLSGQKGKKTTNPSSMGRGIRRLVSLFDTVFDLTDEADWHNEDPSDPADPEEKATCDKLFAGYLLLCRQVPELKKVIEDADAPPEVLDQFLADIQHGANDARTDDVKRVKTELTTWLNRQFSPTTAFDPQEHHDHGLQNDITGRLLCPVDVDWENEIVRANIRNGVLNIADNYFLRCLYPRGTGRPDDLDNNFLRSGWLVKAYCCIFTSPSSINAFEEDSEDGPTRKKLKGSGNKKATKQNVATILRMDSKVTPRSIAYVATVLVFNLTNATQWVEVYNGFSFRGFYNFIVDYFDDVATPETKAHIDSLLHWWNMCIFLDRVTAITNSKASHSKLAAQRARLRASSPLSDLSLNN